MKLKFKHQKYQADAANAVVRCFEGQTKGFRKETIGRYLEHKGEMFEKVVEENIFSNKKLEITNEEILDNVKTLQREQGLKENKKLEGLNFTVEMETGTGKTYVYTKTMYELNKEYGWNKFIIMVPSIAIREGVHKSLEITAEHFQEIYGKKIRFFIYDTKNKSNLNNISSFANTSNIEVIIMNYQAFATSSKESRKIYQKLDQVQSQKPIDIIKRARPILIIDEPQRFGPKAEEIFKKREFDQLFTLRYSATHKNDFNKIYRLDAIDAYNQKLVKKISVKGIEVVGNSGTNSYLFLDRIKISNKHYPEAYLEFEVKQNNGLQKKIRKVKEGDDLYVFSNELGEYRGFVVKEINAAKGYVSFSNGVVVSLGQSVGEIDEEHVRRIQIRETIRSHIDKERALYNQGIKVLSLFFIDEVAKYRQYDSANDPVKGEYARIFEEEYKSAVAQATLFDPEYQAYLRTHKASDIHSGYFSIDKKTGNLKDPVAKKLGGTTETGSDDVSAFDLIMKNKERLLSFEEPTRFIFSHSALREGWDNPNVFQICTLKHSQSVISKRQEIGRGLRICVDQHGERMDESVLGAKFFDTNKLTVVASESYEDFASELQKEIVASLSNRPTKLTVDVIKNTILQNENGDQLVLDAEKSMNLIFHLKEQGYITSTYHVDDSFIHACENKTYSLPDEFDGFEDCVAEVVKNIYDADKYPKPDNGKEGDIDEHNVLPNENFKRKEFQDLWKKIKVKTVYEVDFNSDELIGKSVAALDKELEIKKVTARISTGNQTNTISETSLKAGEALKKESVRIEKFDSLLGSLKYDLIGELAKATHLTRSTICKILQKIHAKTFEMFRQNPESFIVRSAKIINSQKAATLINNIKYSKLDQTYDDSIFTINHLQGKLQQNILEASKHIQDYVKTDSPGIEMTFAEDLESNEDVIIYAKLPAGPGGFQIPTPVGNYSPDWAIVFDTDKYKYIYFIAETKGSMDSLQLKGMEQQKIDYARKHFEALGHADLKFDFVDTFEALQDKVMKG